MSEILNDPSGMQVTSITCKNCGRPKKPSEMRASAASPSGYRQPCKECTNNYNAQLKKQKKEAVNFSL